MAGKKGLKYEEKIRNQLIRHGFNDETLVTGGFKAKSIDAYFYHEKKKFNLELKNDYGGGVSKADYGQIMLDYDFETKEFLIPNGKTTSAKIKSRIFQKSDFLEVINNDWTETPLKILFREKIIKELTKADYEADKKTFQSSWTNYPIDYIHEYYENAGDYYIQINGLGFFCLAEDPAGFEVPQLEGISRFRSRRKPKSSQPTKAGNYSQYNFWIAIKLLDPIKSDFDLMDCNRLPPIKPKFPVTCTTCKNKTWW